MKIKHIQWGTGTVLYEISGGYQLLVNFDNHGKISVMQKDCEEIKDAGLEKEIEEIKDAGLEKEIEEIKDAGLEKEISGTIEDRKIVEAFRLGIVPTFAVKNITVGREKEIKKVEKWLAKDDESIMIVGEYGQGKSHIIRYIKKKALDEGYLVGYCDIGDESQMHKPKSVLNTIMKSLEFGDKEHQKNSDLASFLKLYAMSICEPNGKMAKNISKFLKPGITELVGKIKQKHSTDNLDNDNYFADFVDYLCGDEDWSNLYKQRYGITIQDYQTSASIVCNVISSIGHIAATMSSSKNNFKGLILIFDEGETIDSPGYQRKQRDSGKNFIKGLTEISNNNKDLLSEKMIMEYGPGGKSIGSQTNLMYSRVKMHVNERFSNHDENHVKCLFAFVEGQGEVINMLEKQGVEKISLEEFSPDEKYKLINKVIEIYKNAYGYEVKDVERLKDIIIKKLGDEDDPNTRSIIKTTVEALEIITDAEMDRDEDEDEIHYEKHLR